MIVFGINPVLEAVRSGRVDRVWVVEPATSRVRALLQEVAHSGVPLVPAARDELDRLSRGGAHQGVAAEVPAPRTCTVEDLATGGSEPALILVLDGVEDPQNLGAIARTADAAGVSGLVRQTRRSAALGSASARASAGALAHVRIASVVNIARAIEELKAAGVWVVGLVAESEHRYDAVDLTLPTALVVGAEGTGLRRLVRDRCDWLVSIPMRGRVGSLNVSVAAGVALFEAVRQRTAVDGGKARRDAGPRAGPRAGPEDESAGD